MEAQSKWLWTVTIANAMVACLLIFVVFGILSLATRCVGSTKERFRIPDGYRGDVCRETLMRTAVLSTVAFIALLVPIHLQKAGRLFDESPLNLSLFPAPITRNNVVLSQALGVVGTYVQGGYVLFGVELRAKDGKEPLVNLNLSAGSRLADGLQQIMDQIPEYKYEVISSHLINIYPTGAKEDPVDVLNAPVPQFDAVDVDPTQILSRPMTFIPELTVRLRPNTSPGSQPLPFALHWMGPVNAPKVTLHLKNTTVRQILNAASEAMEQLPPDSQPLGWVYIFQPDPALPAGGNHSWMFLFSAPRNWKQR